MKRYIKSSRVSEDFQIEVADLEGLAYKNGYKLEAKPNNEIELTFNNSDKELMPELIVNSEYDSEESKYTYNVTLKFPDIDTKEYDDTLTYLMNQWSSVANLVDQIDSFEYREN